MVGHAADLKRNIIISITFLVGFLLISIGLWLWGDVIGLSHTSVILEILESIFIAVEFFFILVLLGSYVELKGGEPGILSMGISFLLILIITLPLGLFNSTLIVMVSSTLMLMVVFYMLFSE